MSEFKRKIPVVESVPARMVAIKRTDDLFAVQRRGCQVFFAREKDGQIVIIWKDPFVEVTSMGSAKERRARYAREEAARRKEWRARYAREDAARRKERRALHGCEPTARRAARRLNRTSK
jgi:hypothetical protein